MNNLKDTSKTELVKSNFTIVPEGKNLIVTCFHCGQKWRVNGRINQRDYSTLIKHYKGHYPKPFMSNTVLVKKQTPQTIKEIATTAQILDFHFIMEIMNLYDNGTFDEMSRLINEYGPHKFFADYYMFMDSQKFRSVLNRYYYFVGVTVEFMKYRDIDEFKRPLSELKSRDKFKDTTKREFFR